MATINNMTTKEDFKAMYIDTPTPELDSLIAGRLYAKVPDENPMLAALMEIVTERVHGGSGEVDEKVVVEVE